MIAARGPPIVEATRLIDVDGQRKIDRLGETQQEVGKERARRAAADYGNSRAVGER